MRVNIAVEYMKKEEAALKAAVQHHAFLDMATHEYIKLTGYADEKLKQKFNDMCKNCLLRYEKVIDYIKKNGFDTDNEEFTCDNIRRRRKCNYPYEIKDDSTFRAAQKEMFDQLPGYRQPVINELREYQIFFGNPPIEGSKYPIVAPAWTRDKHLINLPEPLRETIQQCAMDTELDKYYFNKARKENEELRKPLAAACEAYKKLNDADNSHSRNKRVTQALGLSSGKKGNRQTINHRQAYIEYVWLVRNEGKSREEALERVQQEFLYNSVDSARKKLYEELRKVKDWWRSRNDLRYALRELHEELGKLNEFYQPEKNDADIIKNYWKGLIPSKKP